MRTLIPGETLKKIILEFAGYAFFTAIRLYTILDPLRK